MKLTEDLTRTWKWPKRSFDLPPLQLHRGGHLYGEKENTVQALMKAQSLGAQMVEFDVRLTSDGVVILFHDDDLRAFGNDSRRVSDLSFTEMRKLTGCDRLIDVLLHPQLSLALNIELKTQEPWKYELEQKVTGLVREARAGARVLFSSFNPLSLMKLAIFAPRIPRALLVGTEMKDHRLLQEMVLAPVVPFHVLHLEKTRIPTHKSVKAWKKRGVCLAVWTLTSKDEIATYLKWGVDSVISDVFQSSPDREQ